jgi:hypothetical protein
VNRSGWLTFSAVVLMIAGVMRVIDSIWAFNYSGPLPVSIQHAVAGASLTTYGWIWLVTGLILLAAGILVLGPSSQPSAEVARWIGIVAAALGAISGIILVPYYPVWALIYVAIAVTVIYGLSAHFASEPASPTSKQPSFDESRRSQTPVSGA